MLLTLLLYPVTLVALLCSCASFVSAGRDSDHSHYDKHQNKYENEYQNGYNKNQKHHQNSPHHRSGNRHQFQNEDMLAVVVIPQPYEPTTSTMAVPPVTTEVIETIFSTTTSTYTVHVRQDTVHSSDVNVPTATTIEQGITATSEDTTATAIAGRLNLGLDECSWDGTDVVTQTFRQFNAVFFSNYTTTQSQEIFGPLAVGGDFTGNVYSVDTRKTTTCSDLASSLDSYGLVVGGYTATTDTKVHGAVFLEEGGSTSEFNLLDQNCDLYVGNTGRFNFTAVEKVALIANQELANIEPSLILDSNDRLTNIAERVNYDIMTFTTCSAIDNCNLFPDQMSYPDHIFYGNGNWNGVQGSSYPTDKTIIFNIPVDSGSSITLASNQPSNGLTACKTIYNFYPVDSNGDYDSDGTFTIYRNTGGELQGLVLAPLAHIRDGSTGAFTGQVVGLDYAWSTGNGVALKNYASANCQYFNGCIPLIPNPDVDVDVSESESSSELSTEELSSESPGESESLSDSTELPYSEYQELSVSISTLTVVSLSVFTETYILPSIFTETSTLTSLSYSFDVSTTTEHSTETATAVITTTETHGSVGTITVASGTITVPTPILVTLTETFTETNSGATETYTMTATETMTMTPSGESESNASSSSHIDVTVDQGSYTEGVESRYLIVTVTETVAQMTETDMETTTLTDVETELQFLTAYDTETKTITEQDTSVLVETNNVISTRYQTETETKKECEGTSIIVSETTDRVTVTVQEHVYTAYPEWILPTDGWTQFDIPMKYLKTQVPGAYRGVGGYYDAKDYHGAVGHHGKGGSHSKGGYQGKNGSHGKGGYQGKDGSLLKGGSGHKQDMKKYKNDKALPKKHHYIEH